MTYPYRVGSLIRRHCSDTDGGMPEQYGIVCEVNGGDGFRVFWSVTGRDDKWRYAEMFQRETTRGMTFDIWYEVIVY